MRSMRNSNGCASLTYPYSSGILYIRWFNHYPDLEGFRVTTRPELCAQILLVFAFPKSKHCLVTREHEPQMGPHGIRLWSLEVTLHDRYYGPALLKLLRVLLAWLPHPAIADFFHVVQRQQNLHSACQAWWLQSWNSCKLEHSIQIQTRHRPFPVRAQASDKEGAQSEIRQRPRTGRLWHRGTTDTVLEANASCFFQ